MKELIHRPGEKSFYKELDRLVKAGEKVKIITNKQLFEKDKELNKRRNMCKIKEKIVGFFTSYLGVKTGIPFITKIGITIITETMVIVFLITLAVTSITLYSIYKNKKVTITGDMDNKTIVLVFE